MDKKIIVTGASGYVGAKVYSDLCKSYSVLGTYNSNKLFSELVKVDLTDSSQIQTVFDNYAPSLIIHIAADAHTKTCEANPEYAQKINVDSTKYIVDYANSKNIPVIYISTFACFNPTNVYGKTKKQAEELIETLNSYLIIRASLVIGLSPNTTSENFFNQLLTDIKHKKSIEADTSWTFEVTYLDDLSKAVNQFVSEKLPNTIIPFIADGIMSRYDVAKKLVEPYGINVVPIDQKRNIPIQEFDKSIYSLLTSKRMTATECLEDLNKKVSEFINVK